jgi:hypothetical protein
MADIAATHIRAAFQHALNLLDNSEAAVRDAIESDLMDVAGPNAIIKGKNKKAIVEGLMKKIAVIRVKAHKEAFKHLRATLPHV